MSDADRAAGRAGRDYRTVALVAVAVVAVVLAATLLPALSAGASGSPAESLVPLPPDAPERGGNGAGAGPPGDGRSFGALDAGERQSVGGPVGSQNAFQSRDTETHFTVRSEEPAYWRTGAYDTYTGGGWERSAPSDASAPTAGRTLRYSVTLAQSASAPPTVWRPESLSGPDLMSLTEARQAGVDAPLAPGTRYEGVSRLPPSDPSVLRASGRDYPDRIAERYTRLPAETEAALADRTADVTANASDPYETAALVEAWLESNKAYSLNVSDPGDDVAREFVFDMEAGYCEYFATSMVAMLRTQDVPARYVVGYSTGDRVDDTTYQVRAMNAHAWVEVYFAGVGWVRFDPTPAAPRVAQQAESLEASGEDADYDPPTAESPGETQTPQEPSAAPTDSPETPTSTPPSPAETPDDGGRAVSLNRTAVPGATVEVSVTDGDAPVVDAVVRFNGESVGRTDAQGTVVATVPYADALTISASGGQSVPDTSSGTAPSVDLRPSAAARQTQTNTTRTVDVPSEAVLSLSGDLRTGARVTVTAVVRDGTGPGAAVEAPVRNATVTLDGERVARTDDRGRAAVSLPGDPGNVTLRVERGAVSGERTLRLSALRAEVDPRLPLPVAGSSVEVQAFLGDRPEPGATVRVDGEAVGETGVNGTLAASLPLAGEVPVTVSAGGQTVRTTVSNPLANLLGAVAVAAGLVVGAAAALSRRGVALRDLPGAVAGAVRTVYRGAVRALVGGAAVAAARLRRTAAALRSLAAGRRSLASLLRAARAWFAALPARARRAAPSRTREGSRPSPAESADGEDAPDVTVREAWGRFLGHVSLTRVETRTPGQVAAHAVAVDDLPPDAVAALRDAFRAVEYGPRSEESVSAAAAAAVEAIETAAAGDASADGGTPGAGDRRPDATGRGDGR